MTSPRSSTCVAAPLPGIQLDLQTVSAQTPLTQVIDLGDDMEFELIDGPSDVLSCTDPSVPTDASNLVIKALDLFRRKTDTTQRFRVHLEKRVPHGAHGALLLSGQNWFW